jgi:Flp pilus assembly pilin Flp
MQGGAFALKWRRNRGIGNRQLVEPSVGVRFIREMSKLLACRRATTSIEYALLAAAIAVVLFEVMQVPAQVLGQVLSQMIGGSGGQGN